MEYTIQRLAALAGVTTRTLRYYDSIGLLKPKRREGSEYRVYGEQQVDRLQQILFYREMGMELAVIRETLDADSFQQLAALESHLERLLEKKKRMEQLIETVTKTMEKEKGRIVMTDQEKFEGFKKEKLQKNEEIYGTEIREKYGAEQVEKSNAKWMQLTEEAYREMEQTEKQLLALLQQAVKKGESPKSTFGKEAAELHKKWLSFIWTFYTPEAHRGLVEMYVADERFRTYYDREREGCAQFLKNAVQYHM